MMIASCFAVHETRARMGMDSVLEDGEARAVPVSEDDRQRLSHEVRLQPAGIPDSAK